LAVRVGQTSGLVAGGSSEGVRGADALAAVGADDADLVVLASESIAGSGVLELALGDGAGGGTLGLGLGGGDVAVVADAAAVVAVGVGNGALDGSASVIGAIAVVALESILASAISNTIGAHIGALLHNAHSIRSAPASIGASRISRVQGVALGSIAVGEVAPLVRADASGSSIGIEADKAVAGASEVAVAVGLAGVSGGCNASRALIGVCAFVASGADDAVSAGLACGGSSAGADLRVLAGGAGADESSLAHAFAGGSVVGTVVGTRSGNNAAVGRGIEFGSGIIASTH